MTLTERTSTEARYLQRGDRGGSLGRDRRVVRVRTTRYGQIEVTLKRRGSTACAYLPPSQPMQVERLSGGPGQAIRSRTVNRRTGATVEVVDTYGHNSPVHPALHHDESEGAIFELDPALRWAVRCVTHGSFDRHPTFADARAASFDPRAWCARCGGAR